MENSSNRQVSFTQSIVLFYKTTSILKAEAQEVLIGGGTSINYHWICTWIFRSFSGFYDYENGYGVFSSIFNLINLIPGLALSVRRLHDIGKCGWWNLLIFTLIGIIPLIYWACKKGETETNKFGDDLEAGR